MVVELSAFNGQLNGCAGHAPGWGIRTRQTSKLLASLMQNDSV
jgi:hypothetical protein